LACILYANDHNGALPQTLGDTAQYINNPQAYLRSDHAAAAAAAQGLPADQLKDWIDQNSDWTYLGNGQKLNSIHDPAKAVLAYQKGEATNGPVGALFADGHCEEMSENALQQALAKQ
jgi:prepilin-type processing-associated H-X9-DG protein